MSNLKVVEPEASTAIAALVNEFLADRRANGLSIRTVGWYEDVLRREFLPWCVRERIEDPARLTSQLVGGFTTRLLDRGGRRGPLSKATVQGYVRAVRIFLGWSEKEGGATVGARPTTIKLEKHPLIDVLSRDEIQAMENAAKTERDKLIVRVLADTGIRLGELLGIRVEDLWEPKRGEFAIKVHGKGDRDRVVPLAPAVHRRLRRYLAGRGADRQDRVFVALRKGPGSRYLPITKNGVEQAVRVLALEAGIQKRVYPHIFRHSFATDWLRKGGNIISLQRVMGHADLAMIQGVYSHLSTSDDYAAAMRVLMGAE